MERIEESDRERDRITETRRRDANRDPITREPGSHPVGTGVGSAGGAAAGAALGAPFGPVGVLVGGAIGAVAGGVVGHAAGEKLDPTAEDEYWREAHRVRPYFDQEFSYEADWAPAYRHGWEARENHPDRRWDDTLESDLGRDWESRRGESRLDWERAREAARDAWDRGDRTYRTYDATDRYWKGQYAGSDHFNKNYNYDNDYRPAYRYGTWARAHYIDRAWDSRFESDLKRGWERHRGNSRLDWDKAKHAARDAWHGVGDAVPGERDEPRR